MLKERGVKNVRALTGGWNTWVGATGAVEKGRRLPQRKPSGLPMQP
jgi:3-mercaptopyruvate sulfurtransferase SseA